MLTKRLCSDQILYRLYGGYPDVANPVQPEDIWKALEQIVNQQFRLQQFSVNLPSGESIPDGLSIATYEDVTVTSSGSKSKAILPVIPVSLPKNIGIFLIRTAASLGANIPQLDFIPLLKGQWELLQSDDLLCNLLNQVGYTPANSYVTFTQDITLYGVTKVDMDLVVFDLSGVSETDILPIPASMEQDVINQLMAIFSPVNPETGQVNLLTTAGQNPK
jgi:hypothetical protein